MKLGLTFYFEEDLGGVLIIADGGATPLRKGDMVVGCSYATTDDVDLDNTYLAPFLSTEQAIALLQNARTVVFYRGNTAYIVERDANNVWQDLQFIVEHGSKEVNQ